MPCRYTVLTSPGGDELRKHYDCIIHTTPPFHNYPPVMTKELKQTLGISAVSDLQSWLRELLRSCYRQSFNLAFENNTQIDDSLFQNPMRILGFGKPYTQQLEKRLAVPLMGSGCRAFPKDIAVEVAALESTSWLSKSAFQTITKKRHTTTSNECLAPDSLLSAYCTRFESSHISSWYVRTYSCIPTTTKYNKRTSSRYSVMISRRRLFLLFRSQNDDDDYAYTNY
jgi:hypothetical protein